MRSIKKFQCPICSSNGDLIYENLKDNLFFCTNENFGINKCKNSSCGSLWVNPCIIDEDLIYAYKNYYTHGENRKGIIFNIFKKSYHYIKTSFLAFWISKKERLESDYMNLWDDIPGKILDIGCGDGKFLKRMQTLGWNCYGLDFDSKAVSETCKNQGISAEVGGIEKLGNEYSEFDVITMSHLIEHVPNPIKFMAECRKHLKEGGKLVIRTPNTSSYGHDKFKNHWRGLEVPRHIQIFNRLSLETAAKEAGFKSNTFFTSITGAEGILVASYMLKKYGKFENKFDSFTKRMEAIIFGVMYSIIAAKKLNENPYSGEELYGILRK